MRPPGPIRGDPHPARTRGSTSWFRTRKNRVSTEQGRRIPALLARPTGYRKGPEVPAQVADQIGQDQPVGEAPGTVHPRERVVVAAAEDRLEREVGPRLQDREAGAR